MPGYEDSINENLRHLSLQHSDGSASTLTPATSIPNKPKTSLLSSSLAHEKYKIQSSLSEAQTQTTAIYIQSNNHGGNVSLNEFDNRNVGGEYSSPSLLASSVGEEFNGRLIPSSSTISLLSLNTQNESDARIEDSLTKIRENRTLDNSSLPNSLNYNLTSPTMGKGSFTNLNSWRPNHLNQQRLSHYQSNITKLPGKLVSPSPIITPVSQHASPKAIPFSFKQQGQQGQQAEYIPDSPNLIPTSLGGSPSQFWLASQTPPASLSNSYNQSYFPLEPVNYLSPLCANNNVANMLSSPSTPFKNRRSSFNQNRSQPISIPNRYSSQGNSGNMSPVLNPVQTPHEAPPMTPLLLSGMSFNQNDLDISVDDIE